MADRDRHESKRYTGGRTTRLKDRRRLKADTILARTDWLGDSLVLWSGRRVGAGAHADEGMAAEDYLPQAVEARLADADQGLYAVKVGFADRDESPFALEVRAVTRVDDSLLGDTARALNAARRFPKVIGRKLGSLSGWQTRAEERARGARRCLEAAEEPTSTSGLALEEDAVWLGSAVPPSRACRSDALVRIVGGPATAEQPGARISAVVLGLRHRQARLPNSLEPWYALGAGLGNWDAPNVLSFGASLGVDRALSLVSAAAWLNGAAYQVAIHECRLAFSVLEPKAAREWLALFADGGEPPASGVQSRLRSLRLAMRFRAFGVPALPETLSAWADTIGWEGAFVRPAQSTPTGRWCGVLYESLGAFVDRVRQEDDDLGITLRQESFREWVRRAAPLGPQALEVLFEFRPWRANGPPDPCVSQGDSLSQLVVERAVGWLRSLPHGSPSRPARLPVKRNWELENGRSMPCVALALRDARARDDVLDIGSRLVRAGALPWTIVVDLIDGLSRRPEWQRLSQALPRAAIDTWVTYAVRLLARTHRDESGAIDESALDTADLLAAWCARGFAVDDRLVGLLTSREGAQLRSLIRSSDVDTRALALRVSGGNVPRLRNALVLGQGTRRHAWPLLPGWTLLARYSPMQSGIAGCFDWPELVPRAARMLDRLALAIRLNPGPSLGRTLARLAEGEKAIALPAFLRPEDALALRRLAHLREQANLGDGLPRPLSRILDSDRVMSEELQTLRLRAVDSRLDPRQETRLQAIERLQGDRGASCERITRHVSKVLPKQVSLAALAALEGVARAAVDEHWRAVLTVPAGSVPDTADWDNALEMVHSVRYNRRRLLDLLRHEVRGDRSWIRGLAANQAFVACIADAGLDVEEWLAPRALRLPTPGGGLTAYVAENPLEILQMGNLFGTCLSADGSNAHAAVAAAAEVNKRVLYVRDAHGRVHGRKLLALTRHGELLGFHSYGSGELDEAHAAPPNAKRPRDVPALQDVRPWVKLAFDLLSLDLARASSARLRRSVTRNYTDLYLTDEEERSLELSCRGYLDQLEPFDWWIEELLEAGRTGERDQALVRDWLTDHQRPALTERPWETCRAFMWLGSSAPALTPVRVDDLGLQRAQLAVLARHASSPRLRREARKSMLAG